MFDSDRRYDERYVDPEPVRERRRFSWRDVTPMWALPLLLIPLALLVWGGSLLLRNNDANSRTLTQEANTTRQTQNQDKNGLELGVGGSGDSATPTPRVTNTPTVTKSPTSTPSAEAGVGGGPDDVESASDTVPNAPSTGHGW